MFTYLLFIRVSVHQLDRYIQRFYSCLFFVLPSQWPPARPLHTTLLCLRIYCSSESVATSQTATYNASIVAYLLFFRVSGHQLDRYIQRFHSCLFFVLPSQWPPARPLHTTLPCLHIYCSSEWVATSQTATYNASIVAYSFFFRVSSHQLDHYIQRFYVYVFIVHPSAWPPARPLHTTLL